MKTLRTLILGTIAAAAACVAVAFSPLAPVIAQGFNIPNNAMVLGHLLTGAGPTGLPPVGVGCTINAGSTDLAGACLTTTTSGSITFAQPFVSSPFCLVVDRTATPVAAYSVSNTAITLSALTNAHNIQWVCIGKQR